MVATELPAEAKKFLSDIQSNWKFHLYFLKNLPTGWWWGLRVKYADASRCEVTIPYNWFTQNPFRSIYFAALSGAAELSTGMLGTLARKGRPSVSMLVIEQQMRFVKKANTIITFTCEEGEKVFETVEEAIATGEPKTIRMTSVGRNTSGDVVAYFEIVWSFKLRRKK